MFERQISSGARRDPSQAPRPGNAPRPRSAAPRPQDGAPDPCPLCGQRRVWMSAGTGRLVAHCNQDGSDDGVVPVAGAEFCPNLGGPHDMSQWAGGRLNVRGSETGTRKFRALLIKMSRLAARNGSGCYVDGLLCGTS
jgi:hypothetical protein